ncbi:MULTISPECIES: hypothetical protein [unclassified Streptomyces]|uniref:hypothetical protein n=1 Tax=unclassified Streptomyces TaxID=2593676 RepID=UPI000C2763EB|nr:hypothetical protein [Streptomyces sp. CB02959]PJN40714.1 hypothetical protein CG747_10230 [Streptomyces sp. CB02959]
MVQVEDDIAEHLLALGDVTSAHIAAPGTRYFLLTRGTARQRPWAWERISRYVTLHTADCTLTVPGTERIAAPTPYWVVPERWNGSYLCDKWLPDELSVSTLALRGPPARRCNFCPAPLWPEEHVTTIVPAPYPSHASREVSAHIDCTPRNRSRPRAPRRTHQPN